MKRCPQCNRTYTDEALSFCLDDGSPLVSASAPSSFDPSATVQYPQSRETTPQPTIAFGPGQPPPPTPPPPQWSPMPPMTPQKRSVWPWILGIGAVLAFMGIGVVILILVLASMGGNNNNNSNTNSNANSNRANRNSNASNTNANTRSTLASHKDDFTNETWYTGSSQYGRTWYEDDEYHIIASNNGYIVMYAPDKPEFYDDNSTVRATVRRVEGESPDSGYGLLVHGIRENNQFRDYGFLIYSGESPKYAIVQHKNSVETKLVSWTATSTIRTGTTPNQLEVRIRDRRLDFYINGQFVTSITDSESFLRGRVGFYSSDTNEVAFDDLEISK
ncbi:MAG: hypothetical protein WAM70_14400 [Pyrinomonadaceae bacterium]